MNGPPHWLGGSFESEGQYEIPILPPVDLSAVPVRSTPFDKAKASVVDRDCLVNFYVADSKFSRILSHPEKYVETFLGYGAITSPDISMWSDSPIHFRVAATWYNRRIGYYFNSKGIPVIPQVRWIDSRDYDHCFAGIAPNSLVAVSNNGCWHDRDLRQGFLLGFGELIERLNPSGIIVTGRLDRSMLLIAGSRTQLFHLPSRQTQELRVA